jgi:hypothetical protein
MVPPLLSRCCYGLCVSFVVASVSKVRKTHLHPESLQTGFNSLNSCSPAPQCSSGQDLSRVVLVINLATRLITTSGFTFQTHVCCVHGVLLTHSAIPTDPIPRQRLDSFLRRTSRFHFQDIYAHLLSSHSRYEWWIHIGNSGEFSYGSYTVLQQCLAAR